jgi:alkanesulfonate monooxygenase SsuD/methylene tetrahydromethanopterin reductase-like flavin-dependent oxidoreductase (luciferase family)
MPHPSPAPPGSLRLGFLSHIEADDDPASAYRDAIDVFVAAEALGYDTAWVIARHFNLAFAGLPAPLVFLAALAEHTSRIHLGTGVLVLPLDDPIRVAEDSAILDALSGGRLELGLGSGPFPGAYEAFGRDVTQRVPDFDTAMDRLRAVLSGTELNSLGERLYPPAPQLLDRLWRAVSRPGPVEATARAGDGLQFSRRIEPPPPGCLDGDEPRQRDIIDRYLATWRDAGHPPDRRPRISISRSVFPATDRRRALDELRPGIAAWRDLRTRHHLGSAAGPDDEQQLQIERMHLGHPDEIVDALLADPTLPVATELMVSFVPARLSAGRTIELLELVATAVAPRLGWTPASA